MVNIRCTEDIILRLLASLLIKVMSSLAYVAPLALGGGSEGEKERKMVEEENGNIHCILIGVLFFHLRFKYKNRHFKPYPDSRRCADIEYGISKLE